MEKHSTPLADVTTPSLDALKAYSTGMKVNVSSGTAAAIPFFKRAVGIDPQFAMAYATLGLRTALADRRRLSGDKIKANAAYQDFLALWKEADPDIPILRQAKAEYANLQ